MILTVLQGAAARLNSRSERAPTCVRFTSRATQAIVTAMRFGLWYLACAVLTATGCSGLGRSVSRAGGEPFPAAYVRIVNTDSNLVQLQIAAREFLPAGGRGRAVWLDGVSHIGDAKYYSRLQAHLDAQTLVLFEGVGPAERDASGGDETTGREKATENKPSRPGAGSEDRGSLQSAMAASLGLVFQLEAIDYRRRNFRNSDLSIAQLRELMLQSETKSGKPGASESFQDLVELMQGDSWFDALLQMALRLLGANPKFRALGRLALIDLLGEIQGDPSRLQGLPPEMKQLLEVLLQRRNEKVLSDLKAGLAQIDRHGSIAVFFGTGHMPDLEIKLRSQLKYRPAEQIWFTVFQVDLAAAKVTPAERKLVDDFVKWQLKQAGAFKSGAK
jgi:hypothetical protein